jgi:hypothetical protein
MYRDLFESEVVSTPIGSGTERRTLASLLEARNRFPGLRSPCPIAKVIKPAVLVRLVRRCHDAVRWRNAALGQLPLNSLRVLFHAHPPQLADQLDEFVRRSLLCQNIRWLWFFERHFHRRFPLFCFSSSHVAFRYAFANEARPLLQYDRPPARHLWFPRADINPRCSPRFRLHPPGGFEYAPVDQAMVARLCTSPSRMMRGEAGNCSTVTC